jgi:hypothetical protein
LIPDTEADRESLAFHVGKAAASRSLSKLVGMRASPGWRVEKDRILEWRFEGFDEREGELYLIGPFVEGRNLQHVISMGLVDALPHISLLVDSLTLLAERGVPPFPLQTDGVIFTSSGGVLFLPPEILRELRALRPFEANLETFETINHPDLEGEALVSFTIAALLYRLSTGRFPFGGGSPEEIHAEARGRRIASPQGRVPEIANEFSDPVMNALQAEARKTVSLEVWKKSIAEWIRTAPFRVISDEEKEKIRRESRTRESKETRRFRLKIFLNKNWKLLAVIGGVAAMAAIIVVSIIGRSLAPRVTHLFPPEKVVRTFYLSMNSLDHDTMSDCVIGGAGKQEINATTNIYIISRVSFGYEGKSNVVSASEWDAQGRPALPSPLTVYGVTGLTLTQEHGEPQPVFTARYDRWAPSSAEDQGDAAPLQASGPRFEGESIVDRVFLKKDGGDWVIYKIDRQEETPIDVSKWK